MATKKVFGLPFATEQPFDFHISSSTAASVSDSSSLELNDCFSTYSLSDDDKVMVLLLERCIHYPGKCENTVGTVTFLGAVEHQNVAGRFHPVKSVFYVYGQIWSVS